eukprot:6785815-Prymnesium_polylepis.1
MKALTPQCRHPIGTQPRGEAAGGVVQSETQQHCETMRPPHTPYPLWYPIQSLQIFRFSPRARADGPARPRPARRISAPRAEHGT